VSVEWQNGHRRVRLSLWSGSAWRSRFVAFIPAGTIRERSGCDANPFRSPGVSRRRLRQVRRQGCGHERVALIALDFWIYLVIRQYLMIIVPEPRRCGGPVSVWCQPVMLRGIATAGRAGHGRRLASSRAAACVQLTSFAVMANAWSVGCGLERRA
jgi:hypothetical protein